MQSVLITELDFADRFTFNDSLGFFNARSINLTKICGRKTGFFKFVDIGAERG